MARSATTNSKKRGSSKKKPGVRAASGAKPPKGPKPFRALKSPETRVYVGDCRGLLSSIPECVAGEVDLIFADPPFNWNRGYDEWDDSMPREDYERFTREWLDLCVKALRPNGSMWVNIPDDTAAEIVMHLKGDRDADGNERERMHMVNWCVWHYRFGQNTQGRFINSKVHALYFCKDRESRTWNPDDILEPSDRATTYFDPRTHNKKVGTSGMRLPMDVWYGKFWGRIQGNNAERRHNHDNQIPEVYLERVIRACSNEGDLVLDPFLGSGTTATVARELDRRSIGLEFSEAMAESALERIGAGTVRVRKDKPSVHTTAIFPPRTRSKA